MKSIFRREHYKKQLRYVVLITLMIVLFSVLSTMIYTHFTYQSMVEDYQNIIRVKLCTMEMEIQEILKRNNKENVPELALAYEQLGTVYACAASSLFSSYNDTGAWGDIALVLLGRNPSRNVFKVQEGLLSENEVAFLEKLSEYNGQLLADITSDESFKVIRVMNTKALEDVLNSHQADLNSFLYE